jgi:hypothetical protein
MDRYFKINYKSVFFCLICFGFLPAKVSPAPQPVNHNLYEGPLSIPLSSRRENKPGALEAKIGPYEKYFRNAEVSHNSKPVRNNETKSDTRRTALNINALNRINRNNYAMLFSVYEQNVEIMRFFMEFLKANPDISLEELRVKTQQLKFNIASCIEILSQIKTSVERNKSTLEETEQLAAQLTVKYMNKPHYSDFANARQKLDFENRVFNFFLAEITNMNTANLVRLHERIKAIIEKITETEQINWSRSNKNLLLSAEPVLVQMIRQNNNSAREEFLSLRNYFRYTELEIVAAQDKLQPIRPPVSQNLSQAEAWELEKAIEAFHEGLRAFCEQEFISQNIIRTRIEQIIENPLSPQELLIGPLSRHLFFNQAIEYELKNASENQPQIVEEKKNNERLDLFSADSPVLPEWI